MARKWNGDNNLWYEDGEPIAPDQVEVESSVQEFELPQDSGQIEELQRQITELKELVSAQAGAADTSQAKDKDASSTESISL